MGVIQCKERKVPGCGCQTFLIPSKLGLWFEINGSKFVSSYLFFISVVFCFNVRICNTCTSNKIL